MPRTVNVPRRAMHLGIMAGLMLAGAAVSAQPLPNPVLFVTQTPHRYDFTTVVSTFGNQRGDAGSAPRGGDLMILYPDGTLRNLTLEAGFGTQAGQDIAVREPCVHWDGQRALFSMVIGGTTQNDLTPVYWQIYEVSGLGKGQTVQIARLPQQPADFNNVSPIYGTDGRIIFTTDRPLSGQRRLYPQLDEYESAPTNTGLWSLDPTVPGGDLRILDHAISGAFSPSIASDGRVIFMRWDHLQRDQQADADADEPDSPPYGSFDYTSEASDTRAPSRLEVFPELRVDPLAGQHGLRFNQFFPWQILEDGTDEETLNHIGRHELERYFDSSRDGLPEFIAPEDEVRSEAFLGIREDPTRPGTFFGVASAEFGTHASGQLLTIEAGLDVNADDMRFEAVTHPNTRLVVESGQQVPQPHEGHFRNPLPMSDGSLVAAHSPGAYYEGGDPGDPPLGSTRYVFRLKRLVPPGGDAYHHPGAALTPGIQKSISYFDNGPYGQLSYTGLMWELDPVEVVARTKPVTRTQVLPEVERQLLEQYMAGKGGIAALRGYLRSNGLALLISRDVTRRADRQQPYNLMVPGGASSSEPGETPEAIAWIQFFQADQVRGYENIGRGGRRPLARVMHDAPGAPGAPAGSFPLAADGSMAAIVPARRALSWSMNAPDGTPVVRERYWLTFQPGEIRVCTNCHGINKTDVLGQGIPANVPAAVEPLLDQVFNPSPVPALPGVGLVLGLAAMAFWRALRGARRGGSARIARGRSRSSPC